MKHVTWIRNMKIALVKGEKALSVNSELYKVMQPFTEMVKNLLFQFDKPSTFSSITCPSLFGSLMSLTM